MIDNELENEQTSAEGSVENNNQNEGISFDPKAFTSLGEESSSLSSEDSSSQESTDNSSSEVEDQEQQGQTDSANDFSWDDSSSTDTQQDQSGASVNSEVTTLDDESNNKDIDQNDLSNDNSLRGKANESLTVIGEQLGIENVDAETVQAKIRELQEENRQFRMNNNTNERIEGWSKLQKLEDDTLLRTYLESQGLSEEDIETQMEFYDSNGVVRVEANKVRNKIDSAIYNEQQQIEEQKKLSVERERQDDVNRRQQLREGIDSVEEFFGMKIANNPEKYKEVRDKHYNYIADGDFAREISSDMNSLMEAAWLWKNRDFIITQMKKAGQNTGRKEILDEIANSTASTVSSSRELPPNPDDNSKAFDPKKFMSS